MRTRSALFAVVLVFAMLAAGCLAAGQAAPGGPTPSGTAPTSTPPTTGRQGADEYADLLEHLRQAGLTVQAGGQVRQPFFGVPGQIMTIGGEDAQVFAYASEEAAAQDAAKVSADGGTIGTIAVNWVAPPHFYHRGSLLVLYVGSDSAVQKALAAALGPQFAGR